MEWRYISAGLHGDEAAPPWGLLEWAEHHAKQLREEPFIIFLAFNPIGLLLNTRMDQRGVEVNLPVAGRSTEISSERVFLDVPKSFSDDRRVFIDKEPIRIDVLAERIRQLMLTRTDKTVYLRGDGGITYQELMDVIDGVSTSSSSA